MVKSAPRHWLVRLVLGFLKGLGVLLTFVVALVLALLLSIDAPLARRVVAREVSGFLDGLLAGTIDIQRIGHIGVGLRTHLDGVDIRIADPEGVEVIVAKGVTAELDLLPLLRGLPGRTAIDVVHLGADEVRVELSQNAAEELRVATVFVVVDPAPPSDAPSTFYLSMGDIEVAHTHITNHVALPVQASLDALRAEVRVDPDVVHVGLKGTALSTQGMPRGAEVVGHAQGALELPAASGRSMGVEAALAVAVGGVPLGVRATLDGMHLQAVVHGADPRGERLHTLVPELPKAVPVQLTVSAHGVVARENPDDPVPVLDVSLDALAAGANLHALARLRLDDTMHVEAAVRAGDVDLAKILVDGPDSDLAVEAHAAVALGDTPAGSFRVQAPVGTVAGQVVPGLRTEGRFTGDEVHASGTVLEPGAPIDFNLAFLEQERLVFDLRSGRIALGAVPRLGGVAKGTAQLKAEGHVTLPGPELAVHAEVKAHALQAAGVQVGKAQVDVRARGFASTPVLDVKLDATRVDAMDRLHLEHVAAATTVDLDQGVRLLGTKVVMHHARDEVGVQVGEVDLRGGNVAVRRGGVRGFGEPLEFELSQRTNAITVRAKTPSLDLTKVVRFLGLARPEPPPRLRPRDRDETSERPRPSPPPVEGSPRRTPVAAGDSSRPRPAPAWLQGSAAIDVDVELSPKAARGHVEVVAHDVDIYDVHGLNARVHAHLDDRDLQLGVQASVGELGVLGVRGEAITLAGSPVQLASWRGATGQIDVESRADLGKIHDKFPELIPASQIGGVAKLVVRAMRPDSQALPDVFVQLKTQSFAFAPPLEEMPARNGDPARALPAAYRLRGMDAEVTATYLVEKQSFGLAARLFDAKGNLVTLDASTPLRSAEILAGTLPPIPELGRRPFQLRVHAPPRRMAELPEPLRVPGVDGRAEVAVAVRGSLAQPQVDVSADVRRIESSGIGRRMPLDLRVRASYDGEQARASLGLVTERRSLVDAQATVRAKLIDLFGRPADAGEPPWDASAQVQVNDLPLDLLADMADRNIRGRLRGQIALRRYHQDAALAGNMQIAGLRVGDARYDEAAVLMQVIGDEAKVALRVVEDDGWLQGEASLGVAWGARLVPEPLQGHAAKLALTANQFRLAVLQPLLPPGTLQQLDGRLDAELAVDFDPASKKFASQGFVELSDGVVQTPYLGDAFEDVAFRATLAQDGAFKLEGFTASSLQGRVKGAAAARFNGLQFVAANANFAIPRQSPLGLSILGTPLGTVYGSTQIAVKQVGDPPAFDVDVKVPELRLQLPKRATQDVQALERPENVRVGLRRSDEFVPLAQGSADLEDPAPPSDARPVVHKIHVKLGDVQVEVPGLAKVNLTGGPDIAIGDETTLTGQVLINSGSVDVRGKRFEVEQSSVTFDGQPPSNPVIAATAAWTAQDQTRVYVDYRGPVQSGTLTFRSEPARSKDEILSLLLFGSAEGMGQNRAGSSSVGTQAAGAALGNVTGGIGEAIDGLTGIKAQARIDTTNANNARPELEVEIAENLSLTIAHVLGVPPASEPDRNLVTVSWRFRPFWSLLTTVGDAGKTLMDVIWQYRY